MGFLCRWAAPALGLVLLAVEAAVASLALWFPHETKMYRQFYVEQSRDCYLPAGAAASAAKALTVPEITFSELNHDAACYMLTRGWARLPRALPSIASAPSSQAASAFLEIPRPANAVAFEIILANASSTAPQAIQLIVNRRAGSTFILPAGNIPTRFQVSASYGQGADVNLQIRRPSQTDLPTLKILGLKWITR